MHANSSGADARFWRLQEELSGLERMGTNAIFASQA
jgi:hypothetical protein